jgi:uncharacterized cupin superfamily protein
MVPGEILLPAPKRLASPAPRLRWTAGKTHDFLAVERLETMLIVNSNELEEETWSSPKGKFHGAGKGISEALGRKSQSTDLNERHPFDVEILRIPAGKVPYPYHQHSAQWEFYHIISGTGSVRHNQGVTTIKAGDAFLFKPGEPHQLINNSQEDLILYVVADNPIGESTYYPDSKKWGVREPERRLLRSEALEYYDGEE